jgi:hypothetical protein
MFNGCYWLLIVVMVSRQTTLLPFAETNKGTSRYLALFSPTLFYLQGFTYRFCAFWQCFIRC